MARGDDVVTLRDGETLQVTDSSVRGRALHRLLHRRRRTLSKQFERDQPFSVSRFLLAVFSYSLLVSDPDNVITVGPYAYPLLHLRWNDTAVTPPDATVPYWPYKYDSTSMTMRAVAELLAVPNWSSCVLWRTPADACNEPAGLPLATVFRMIDIVSHGRQDQDVVVFTRVRDCASAGDGTCRQAYMWLRLLLLFAGVLYARVHWERQGSVRKMLLATLRTFFLIPSQVVTYGSVFPILCYVSAHSIDVSAVYEFVAHHFSTPLGQYHFKLGEVVELGAVSMRSMWVMAAFCHLVVAISTRRSWTPENGVIGIPEFFITLVAASTIFAHSHHFVAGLAHRGGRRGSVHAASGVHARRRLRGRARLPQQTVLVGLTIDIQFLLSSFVAVAVAIGGFELLRRLALTFLRHKLVIVSRTLVPYSASSLWLTNALVISWHGTIVTRVVERAVSSTAAPKLAMLHPEIESLIYLVNVAVLTDPLTFLRSRVLGGGFVGLYQSRRSDRCFLLPYRLGSDSSADAHIDLSDFDLLGVFDTKEVYWWDLLQCG
ncbi:hypothetical protein P43SY_009688 [Pythium insidiosum]|uniref:Transmembrane protein n=1 Tax=Pythium insidiosum TaxID=114742 RepID=A0AAD5Q653_PYTIN|nr:hypothetical protein P43SY_009688 [Pythium insidiosum]